MIEQDRIITADAAPQEQAFDRALRPVRLAEYVGQPAVKEQLEIFISAAKGRGEPLDHTLIFGPPGLGKTTLAHIIAQEMQVSLKSTSGPVLEKAGDLAALLTNLEPGDVLFVDEIHRLSPVVEEILYPAMEDYQLDIMIGEGPQRAPSNWICPSLPSLARPPGLGSDLAASGSPSALYSASNFIVSKTSHRSCSAPGASSP